MTPEHTEPERNRSAEMDMRPIMESSQGPRLLWFAVTCQRCAMGAHSLAFYQVSESMYGVVRSV